MPNIWISRAVCFIVYCIFFSVMSIGKHLDPRFGLLPDSVSIKPTRSFKVASSKKPTRRIKVDVFEPPRKDGESKTEPLPVHVNFHASGFVAPIHGCDAEFCVYLCQTLGCIVLDVDYAKAPFHSAPSAMYDALDVLDYIASHPDVYKISRVTLGGFSSGANIAILASVWSKSKVKIRGVVAWYPPTNLARTGQPDKARTLTGAIHRCMRQSYLPPGTDAHDPRISPLFAPSEQFPPLTLIVGSEDKLLVDSVDLHEKLERDGVDCVLSIVPEAGHAWEWSVEPGTHLWLEREKAMELMEQRLRLHMHLY